MFRYLRSESCQITFAAPTVAWVGFGMANARNGERFLTGMANAYGRTGENAIIDCYDLKYKIKYNQCICFIATLAR